MQNCRQSGSQISDLGLLCLFLSVFTALALLRTRSVLSVSFVFSLLVLYRAAFLKLYKLNQ